MEPSEQHLELLASSFGATARVLLRIASKGRLWHPSTYSVLGSATASFRFLNRPELFSGGSLVSDLKAEFVRGEDVTYADVC